jgi:hypothetical protein
MAKRHKVAGKAHVKKAKGGRKRHHKGGHKKSMIKA